MVMILPMPEEVKDQLNFKAYSILLKDRLIKTSNLDQIKEIISKVHMVHKIEWVINSRIYPTIK